MQPLLFLLACDDGAALEGLYTVTEHAEASGCAGSRVDVDGDPSFLLTYEASGSSPDLTLNWCRDANDCDADSDRDWELTFGSAGWSAWDINANPGGEGCEMSGSWVTFTHTPDSVTYLRESREGSISGELGGGSSGDMNACTDAVEQDPSLLDCTTQVNLAGTRAE